MEQEAARAGARRRAPHDRARAPCAAPPRARAGRAASAAPAPLGGRRPPAPSAGARARSARGSARRAQGRVAAPAARPELARPPAGRPRARPAPRAGAAPRRGPLAGSSACAPGRGAARRPAARAPAPRARAWRRARCRAAARAPSPRAGVEQYSSATHSPSSHQLGRNARLERLERLHQALRRQLAARPRCPPPRRASAAAPNGTSSTDADAHVRHVAPECGSRTARAGRGPCVSGSTLAIGHHARRQRQPTSINGCGLLRHPQRPLHGRAATWCFATELGRTRALPDASPPRTAGLASRLRVSSPAGVAQRRRPCRSSPR